MKKKAKEKCEESKIRDGALGMGREVWELNRILSHLHFNFLQLTKAQLSAFLFSLFNVPLPLFHPHSAFSLCHFYLSLFIIVIHSLSHENLFYFEVQYSYEAETTSKWSNLTVLCLTFGKGKARKWLCVPFLSKISCFWSLLARMLIQRVDPWVL